MKKTFTILFLVTCMLLFNVTFAFASVCPVCGETYSWYDYSCGSYQYADYINHPCTVTPLCNYYKVYYSTYKDYVHNPYYICQDRIYDHYHSQAHQNSYCPYWAYPGKVVCDI